MSLRRTAMSIQRKFNDFEMTAQIDLDKAVRLSLDAFKRKYNCESIEILSGMGTWVFFVDGADYPLEKSKPELLELNAFLEAVSGDYNLYPLSTKV